MADNYATWAMYLVIINVLASIVFAGVFAISDVSMASALPTDSSRLLSLETTAELNEEDLDSDYGTTFILSLIFIPINLWNDVPPVGLLICIFFALLKIGIIISAYKIINPVSSG